MEKEEINLDKGNFITMTKDSLTDYYKIIRIIGEGGFGKVYEVQNRKTLETFACKKLSKLNILNLMKFKDEIRILSKSDHPNIIKLYEIYESNRSFYLIMELCKGGQLFNQISERAQKKNMYTEKDAAEIFQQIMSSIEYCHNQGICHRDLKPENILYLKEGNEKDNPLKIIDFGLSKYFRMNKLSSRVGSVYYISPEVLEQSYTEKCDVWSGGVLLFLLLSGKLPFVGRNDNDIFAKIKSLNYNMNDNIWKNISDEAKDLIKHMLCDADKRYNAENVLNHPWIEKNAPNANNTLAKFNVQSLKDFGNFYKLTKYVLGFIASRVNDEEIEKLKKIFEELDVNKSGTLNIKEIKNGIDKMKQEKNLTEEEKDDIIKHIDTNKSEKIEYNEFLAACLEQKIYLREENLLNAFIRLDYDGSGKISKKEIKQALNDEVSKELLEKIIQEFDLNSDGEIDYREFIEGMNKAYKKEEHKDEKVTNKKK